jgi:helix-turn-helix protein
MMSCGFSWFCAILFEADHTMIKLGKILNSYRLAEKIPLRDLAREIGIDHTVLAKFENGRATKEATLAKIFVWLLSQTSSDCGQQKRRHGGWQPGQSGNPEGSRKHKPKAKPAALSAQTVTEGMSNRR